MYIAREESWFDTGQRVELIKKYDDGFGLFIGPKTVIADNRHQWHKVQLESGVTDGDVVVDEETCGFDEFKKLSNEETNRPPTQTESNNKPAPKYKDDILFQNEDGERIHI